jgi:hypothetical protein
MATTKRPVKKAAKKGARKPTKTATRKPAAKPPKAAKKAAKKAVKKSASRSAAATRRAGTSSGKISTSVARRREPYAIHLPFEKYAEFAKDLTRGSDKQYYKTDRREIQDFIETFLRDPSNYAMVYEDCSGVSRPFTRRDRIRVEVDDKGNGDYVVAIPSFICEDANGEVDIAYLEAYVRSIQASTVHEAAWALLGMYFLSRCR